MSGRQAPALQMESRRVGACARPRMRGNPPQLYPLPPGERICCFPLPRWERVRACPELVEGVRVNSSVGVYSQQCVGRAPALQSEAGWAGKTGWGC